MHLARKNEMTTVNAKGSAELLAAGDDVSRIIGGVMSYIKGIVGRRRIGGVALG